MGCVLVLKHDLTSEIPLSCGAMSPPPIPCATQARATPGCCHRPHSLCSVEVARRCEEAPPRLRPDTTPGSPWLVLADGRRASAPPIASNARNVSCMYAGFEASGQLESLTDTVPVRRLTCSICPCMPNASRTSPCSPGLNQNWLRYHPPGNEGSAPESKKACRTSASTAHVLRSH